MSGKFIEDGFYLLQFDGVGLLFSIPTEFEALYSDGSRLPLELPDGTSPVLNRVYIYPLDFQLLNSSPYRDIVQPRVLVDLAKPELRLALGDRESTLSLEMCPQEVLSNIGCPDFSSTHPKSENFSQHFEYYSLGAVPASYGTSLRSPSLPPPQESLSTSLPDTKSARSCCTPTCPAILTSDASRGAIIRSPFGAPLGRANLQP
jgi:hypothetical protein